jgi:TLC ATP/ADP transporter
MQCIHRCHHGSTTTTMIGMIMIVVVFVVLAPSVEAFTTQHYPYRSVPTTSISSGIWYNDKVHTPYRMVSTPSKLYMSTDTTIGTVVGDDDESLQTISSTTTPTTTTKAVTTIWEKVKAVVPPANERQKLIPLACMFFCILFSYTILRDTKDVLMITAPKSGAEVIPFIKTYVNLPVAIVCVFVYI